MRLRADSTTLRRVLRTREMEVIFQDVPEDGFERCLELGAGDGFQSLQLKRYTSELISTDINRKRLVTNYSGKIRYTVCDAENIPFKDGEFDLIYSSNLLEHLPHMVQGLSEMTRVMKDGGVMVHVVPNRFWKVLHLGLFYVAQLVALVEVITGDSIRGKGGAGNNPGKTRASFWRRNLFPQAHGMGSSNILELIRFGKGQWTKNFRGLGLEPVKIMDRLPVHSPYRFGLDKVRKRLEKGGFSSSICFILQKPGCSTTLVSWFKRN